MTNSFNANGEEQKDDLSSQPPEEAKDEMALTKERAGKKKKSAKKASSAKSSFSQTAQAAEMAALTEEVERLTDGNLRLQAEVQNVTRRAALDLEKARKFGLESFAKALIETVDNLEKSLAAVTDKEDSIYQGVELTYRSLMTTLEQFGITKIDPQGEPFDPNFHEALGKVKAPQYESNRVVAVVQKGYMLYGRLLRPAKVQIAE